MDGRQLSSLFAIEVFAGTCRLTAILRALGLSDAFGVDHEVSRRLSAPILQLDLLHEASLEHLRCMIREPGCVFVHLAPPCGTASRARLIQRSASDPPIVRTDQHPDGLPHLTGDLAARVQAANQLYAITVELVELCIAQGVLFCIENPNRSFMWDTRAMRPWLTSAGALQTVFHHCEYGSARRKCTRFVHSLPGLALKTCSGTHRHEKWGKTAAGWATKQETAYPWGLCRALAAHVLLVLQDFGAVCQTPAFAHQEAAIQAIRALSNHQHGKAALPLLPEFKEVLQHPAHEPLPPLSRPLSTPRKGYIASAKVAISDSKAHPEEQLEESAGHQHPVKSADAISIGVHWNRDEFLAKALGQGHPEHMTSFIPEELAHALSKAESMSPHELGMERTAELRRWISLANSYGPEEASLKASIGGRRGEILSKKRLTLFGRLIRDAGHTDVQLPDDLAHGFDLTGRLPTSNYFEPKFRPASLPCEALRGVADRSRNVLLSSATGSGQEDLDRALYEVTLKEVQKGFLVGPVDPNLLPAGSTITRRFGVQQKGKLRPIDDYKASMVNSSVTQTEGVSVHTVDHIAAMVSARMRQLRGGRSASRELQGKCWDLAAAYKQVPLSDSAFTMDSFLMVYNPTTKAPEVFQQRVLPFGSVASVTAFLRCSSALWAIGAKLLAIVWTAYFDDFLSLELGEATKHSDMCITMFFSLLGWDVSHEKLLPYATVCKVLGVLLDLRQSGDGLALVTNTPERAKELIEALQEVLRTGKLTRREGERLRGRLQFAAGQLFGRQMRLALTELSNHVGGGRSVVGQELTRAFEEIIAFLDKGEPRRVDTCFLDHVLIFVDASFKDGGFSGAGGMAFDSAGQGVAFFSEEVDREFMASFKGVEQKTVIYELEALAIVVSLGLFKRHILGKRVVVFTDNEGVRGTIARSRSQNATGGALLKALCEIELQLHSRLWCERVPSESNPADRLSREVTETWQGLSRSRCHLCGGDLRDVIKRMVSQ